MNHIFRRPVGYKKGTTINLKNEKDNKCLQRSITSELNYDKIKKKNSAYTKIKMG